MITKLIKFDADDLAQCLHGEDGISSAEPVDFAGTPDTVGYVSIMVHGVEFIAEWTEETSLIMVSRDDHMCEECIEDVAGMDASEAARIIAADAIAMA